MDHLKTASGLWRALMLGCAALAAWSASPTIAAAAPPGQTSFVSAEAAVDALVEAARADDPRKLEKILGPRGHDLVESGDPVADHETRYRFVADYARRHAMETPVDGAAILTIGAEDWPFPIPLKRQGATWIFDTAAGAEEILNRRIGRNELNAIEVVGAIVDAEHEYAGEDRTGSGFLEYARKFISAPGKRDGLYWPAAGTDESPIGPLVVAATLEGYGAAGANARPAPYHGYVYRLLDRQGAAARGGAYAYLVNGHMLGGFGLVAFPAKYGDSGVMTFITNQDGIVFERNLGRDTDKLARAIIAFDPGAGWTARR